MRSAKEILAEQEKFIHAELAAGRITQAEADDWIKTIRMLWSREINGIYSGHMCLHDGSVVLV